MGCPVCGHRLPSLIAQLAQTEMGTQCPKCGTRLRKLKLRPQTLKKETVKRRTKAPRRAA